MRIIDPKICVDYKTMLICLSIIFGTSLVVQWLKLHLPMHGVWVQFLARVNIAYTSQPKKQNINNKSNMATNSIKA